MINKSDDQSKNKSRKTFSKSDCRDRIFMQLPWKINQLLNINHKKNFEISKLSAKAETDEKSFFQTNQTFQGSFSK